MFNVSIECVQHENAKASVAQKYFIFFERHIWYNFCSDVTFLKQRIMGAKADGHTARQENLAAMAALFWYVQCAFAGFQLSDRHLSVILLGEG